MRFPRRDFGRVLTVQRASPALASVTFFIIYFLLSLSPAGPPLPSMLQAPR